MKKKVWEFRILDNPNQAIGGENDQFYTTDTEAFLKFKLLDAEFKPTTATLTLVNNASQSVISETVPVVDGLVEWEMYEEAIAHSGNWQAQLVYAQEKDGQLERYTSQVVQFDVQSHLISGKKPALVAIEDWNTFMATARDLLESFNKDADGKMFDIEQLEQQYLTNETERIANEYERVSNETERVTEESNRAEAEELRESAEATRITNEATRTTAETTRLSKETERLASETERINAENVRTTNETDRVDSEVERKSNEAIRVSAESVREANENIRQSNNEVVEGWIVNRDFDGKDIEFMWDGTNLGVRQEGDTDFQFVDLKGDTGEIENFTAQHIEDALGYRPISAVDVPDPTWANLQNKPTEFNPTSHTHSINDVTGLRAELDSVPELTKENVGLGNVDNVKQASKVDFDNLLENFTDFKGNIGKFRATENGALEYHNGKEWIEVRGGTEFKVGNTSGFTAEAKAGLKIEIKFGDPEDSIIIGVNGDEIKLAELGGTQLRAKKDSYPVDENDGILLVDSKVKNQYKDTPFVHDNLTNGDEWFYMAFPYTKNKVFTVDSANRGSAVATNKLNQTAPPAPTISDLEFDRVTVTGGDVVSLDKVNWLDSPHTFTGLTEETDYVAYAKRKETDEFMESDISPGNAFKTPAEQRIYGVRVDESNSNPETRVTYIGDSVGFTPMSGNNGNFDWGSWEQVFKDFEIRPVILKNKAVNYYLNPNDFTKKADGSSANITGADGDVMNEFGKTLWYKWTDLGSAYTVEVSDKEFPGAVKNAFEIEDGYNLVPYYPLLLTQILGIIFFKSTDSQTALGRGRVDNAAGYASTGGTDKKGMFYGSESDEQMKFLGIEDFWGNKFWWIDGLVTDASRNLLIGKKGFNDSGSGYASHPSGASADIYGYVDTVQGGNDKGFIIKSGGGSATTHYADYGNLYSSRVAYFGGHRSFESAAGAFCLRLVHSASSASAFIGGRLFCASNGKIYIGAYLGTTQSGKLRSVSGSSEPTGNKTIGTFRAEAKANN